METLGVVLPIIIDILIACLLIALIILVVKIIGTINDFRDLLSNIEDKVNTLNGLFNIINKVDTGVNGIAKRVVRIFDKVASKITRKSNDDYVSEEEEEIEEIMKGRE